MSTQISWAEIVDFVEGRLSVAQSAIVERRIAADDSAQQTVAWLKQFGQWREKTRFVEPPAAVDKMATAVFRRKYPRHNKIKEGRPDGALGMLRAALQYDSWQGMALGARSASLTGTETRQLIYSTEHVDIALNLRPRQGNTTIKGQLLPNDDEKMETQFDVVLTQDGTELVQTRIDALGNFRFDGVSDGAYELILRDGESAVTIPDIVI